MERKIKVKLNDDKLTSFFVRYTHCGQLQFVANESLQENSEITCVVCNNPFLLCGSNGAWYYVGEKVFD